MSNSHRFVLYLFDESPKESTALINLKRLCDKHLSGRYKVEVVELQGNPSIAEDKDIFATPTLDLEEPKPSIRIVGDLSDVESVIELLRLRDNAQEAEKGETNND